MIHLLPTFTLDGRFSVQDVPNELQLPLLYDMVVPRITSSSMRPTIQAGDRLELSPPTSLTVGTIVVFRNGALFVCHRITSIDEYGALSLKGDATDGACEIVQPGSVIGVVTGVLRGGMHVSLGQCPQQSPTAAHPISLKSRIRTIVIRSITQGLRILATLPLFRHMLTLLLRWTATVDILTPTPIRSLPSHSTVASIPLSMFSRPAGLVAAFNGQHATHYVVRLGPWRLAQYDPGTESLLLRQSLRDAGLESLFRQIFGECNATYG